MMLKKPLICLLGPTASGKSDLAIDIAKQFPCEIISVDSAMVYRGMDIGTAKPTTAILQTIPHHLINIRDPSEPYSAGQFRMDAMQAIDQILAREKIPLLVGGTMMYFRILQQGLAPLPHADKALRAALTKQAKAIGWEALHTQLAQFDPETASRIHPHDSQRIQRAIEVYQLTGKSLGVWQQTTQSEGYDYRYFALVPPERSILHQRILQRFEAMLVGGFADEVKGLYGRGDLVAHLPSIRSVGYRQLWAHFAGEWDYKTACEKAVIATRQLAKRQLTWLRSWPEITWITDNLQFYQVIAGLFRLP